MIDPVRRNAIVIVAAMILLFAAIAGASPRIAHATAAGSLRAWAGVIIVGNTTPANGDTLGTATPTFVVPYVDSDPNATILGVDFQIDGMNLTSAGHFDQNVFILSLALELRSGPHFASFAVFDNSGGFGSLSWMFTVDTIPPILLVTSPVYPVVPTPGVLVAGTALLANATLFGGAAPINVTATVLPSGASFWTFPAPNGSFAIPVPLTEGVNTIFVNATDRVGNFATVVKSVIRDTTSPSLVILTPTEPVSPTSTVWVSGTTERGSYVFVNGYGVTVSPVDGSWGVNLTLPDGVNIIQVVAADEVGNINFAGVGLLVDSTTPRIVLTSPTVSLTNRDRVVVAGTASDTALYALSVNGNAVTWSASGQFSTTLVLPDGLAPIVVVAVDYAGRVTTLQTSIRVDTIPPVVTVSAPPNGLETNQSTVVLRGTVNEDNATVLVGSVVVRPDATRHWQATLALLSGGNMILVSAIDAAGNQAAPVSIHVTHFSPFPDLDNRTRANAQSLDALGAWVRFSLVGILLLALAVEFVLYGRTSKQIRETRSLLAALVRERKERPRQ